MTSGDESDHSALLVMIEAAEADAAHGCGQSDVLFERRVQNAYAAILAGASEADRANTEAVLRKRGYDPLFEGYEPRDGECGLTGIEVDCCPCGQHP